MAKSWAKQFYNSSIWQTTRKMVLRRDHYTCRECDRRAEEVHHIIELTPSNIMDYSIALNPDNLISLCRDCHMKRTHGVSDIGDGFIFDDEGQVVHR